MKTIETPVDRATMVLGTAMMVAWTLWLGLVGLMLLLVVFYAMMAANQTLIVAGAFLLFTPFLLTLVWGGLTGVNALAKKVAAVGARYAAQPSWWERRRDFRILYQAYYG
jgi:hypothetical protein